MDRILAIDVLRVLCILLVVTSHYSLIPGFPFSGTHGVVIFFMISGYCIELTSNKKEKIEDFASARFWRLVPTFIFCAIIIAMVELLLPYLRPDRIQSIWDLFLNITCMPTLDIPCGALIAITKGAIGKYLTVDGAFWSLRVEFRYYAFFAILYYILKQKKHSPLLIGLSGFLAIVTSKFLAGTALNSINDFFMYMPFFAFGMSYFRYKNEKQEIVPLLIHLGIFGILASLETKQNSMDLTHANAISYLMCFGIFFVLMELIPKKLEKTSQTFAYIGLLTYPIYLLHQDIGYIIIAAIETTTGHLLAGILAIIGICIGAYIINEYFENRLVKTLRRKIEFRKDTQQFRKI